jgi:aerobic carbon-monoxide dehydrogenase medium subunit
MIPAQFDYLAPTSLKEAVAMLAQHGDRAKLLAGGHSLIPAMKLRLSQPELLVDLGRVKDLSYINEKNGQMRIGAMTTHYQLESSARPRSICPLLPETASHIGDVQVRNKGTIGGSLAHADPAADWPAAIIALQAELVATSSSGERVIKADDFFVDVMTTALAPNEILTEIRVPVTPARTGQAYVKMAQPASGFAVVGIAVTLTRDQSGRCTAAGIGVTGLAPKAYRANKAEDALKGTSLDASSFERAAAHIADGIEPNADLYASAEYRAHLAEVYAKRAIKRAVESIRS